MEGDGAALNKVPFFFPVYLSIFAALDGCIEAELGLLGVIADAAALAAPLFMQLGDCEGGECLMGFTFGFTDATGGSRPLRPLCFCLVAVIGCLLERVLAGQLI